MALAATWGSAPVHAAAPSATHAAPTHAARVHAAPMLARPVRTGSGLIAGMQSEVAGVTAFKGIPFAAPPVGDLRWRPAQPLAQWSGVRAGDKFGPVCIQPHQRRRVPNNRAVDLPDSPPMSEDCLYLNVWTPARSARS